MKIVSKTITWFAYTMVMLGFGMYLYPKVNGPVVYFEDRKRFGFNDFND